MTGEDILVMSRKEAGRLHVIQKVLEVEVKQREAADMLSLSTRQIRRIIERMQSERDVGIAHKARGKGSDRRTAEKLKDRIIRAISKQIRRIWSDTGDREASRGLEGIGISDETLRCNKTVCMQM